MEFQFKYITPDIKLSCNEIKFSKMEVMFDCHMLVWFISGETKIIQPEQTYIFQTGDIFLIPKNQLATIINYPKDGLPHQSVIMHLTTERLKEFYAKLNTKPKMISNPKIQTLSNHPLLESCLSSLIPYFDMQEGFPEEIASLKITEAITILRTINPEIDNILADFSEPYKIDLLEFMEKNFIINMPLEKFAYLTGRSLATFKRDFKKIFQTTPQKWLIQKRLELAFQQITENKQKPIDVYLETGFENLSHFSFAFKKHFGFAPSVLINK